jgi:YbgC/YbaW family acyl-CoA thioester hydrolase
MTKHETRLKVRSYELDVFRHVNNATYLNYLEVARFEMMHEAALELETLITKGIMVVVANINISYRLPAFLNNDLRIMTHVSKIGHTSFTMRHEGYNLTAGNKLGFEADVVQVLADLNTGKPIVIPDALRQKLSAFHQS